MRPSLRLEQKLPLLILVLFSVVLAISTAASYYEVRHAAEQSAGDRLNGLTQVLGSLVEQQFSGRLALMRRAGRDTAVVNALRNPGRPPSAGVTKALAALATPPADASPPGELWTPDGRAVGGNVQLDTPADADHLREDIQRLATSHDSGYVSHLRSANGRATFVFATPVRDSANALLGYVVQERHFNNNPRTLQPFRDLIGSDIDLFFRNADNDTWAQLSGAVVPPPSRREDAGGGLNILTHAKGRRFLTATRQIKGTPLIISVERPLDQILAGPRDTMRILVLIGVLLGIAGAAAAWAVSRRVVRPLGELTGAAEGLASGEYDRRVSVRTGDEIGRLASAFNRMAGEVEASSHASAQSLDRLTEALRSQAFLAEASRILTGPLSDGSLLTSLAEFCVPTLADYCSIHAADEHGMVRRAEVAHRDPAKQAKLREITGRAEYDINDADAGEAMRVIRSQTTLVIPEVDVDGLLAATHDRETTALLQTLRPTSMVCVPLVVRGQGIGAITLAMAGSGRVIRPEDVETATELARRAAVAVDNAVIYRRSLQLRLEAEAASNAKSDFLAKMSHEIRTPINAMMGYAELLQMGISGPVNTTQSKQLERIRSSGDHLTSLVGEILDLAKIEAGQMSVQSSVADANDAAEAALNVVRPQATAKGVELSNPGSDERLRYYGDPHRVHQILTNLLSNAVKFTPASGSVSIRCSSGSRPGFASPTGEAEWVCIVVQDTGVGIAKEDLERIFQPFVQVESVYTRSQGGTGLGLTISRNLAQMMDGDITLKSVAGEGSTFTLWLPCSKPALARSLN